MRPSLRLSVSVALLLACCAGSAAAQYMRITTDNPTDATRLRPTGTTILTITLDTNHDRGGAEQTCNSHTAANCGAPGTTQPLDMFSYTLALKAEGGTVTWGSFTPADANYTPVGTDISSNTEIEINRARPAGTFTPPGLATIGTLPVTIMSGTPRVDVQIGASAINPFGFGTGFGTSCDGYFFLNTYVVGDPTDPCGDVTGVAGDWFDWDGAGAPAVANAQPMITAPATATGAEGSPITPITANATDADAANTLTITATGFPASLVFSSTPGPSPVPATISGTPGFNDAGPYTINWTVNDGQGQPNSTNTASTALTIADTDRAPVLAPIANMTVPGGSTADQPISATDPDGHSMTFSASLPVFATLIVNPQVGDTRTGTIHLAPSTTTTGTFPASVTVSALGLSDTESFTINVIACNCSPVLDQPANMTVNEGATADQVLTATDPQGDPLVFSKVSGPIFMTVTTTTATTGNVHLAPTFTDAGSYAATVQASDGAIVDQKSFSISVLNVNRAPTLNPVADMSVGEGATEDQAISGSDPDADPLTFSKVAGPTFMTVTTTSPTTGNIHLATGFADLGTYAATVRASDGSLHADRSFTILVCQFCSNRPPVLNAVANMTVTEGSVADQTITGADPDGDPLTFTKSGGPAFMTVTTVNPSTGNIHLAPGFTDAGTYSGTVTASDLVFSDSKSFTITVNDLCSPPFIDPVPTQTVPEGTTGSVAIHAVDPAGGEICITVSIPPFATIIGPTCGIGEVTRTISFAPGYNDAGAYSITVNATTSCGTRSLTFTLNVPNTNRAPTLSPIPSLTIEEGMTADVPLSGSDPDGDPLTFSFAGCAPFLTISTTGPTTGLIHVAPGFADAGSYTCTVSVSDGQASDSETFSVTVLNRNSCPVADPGGPYSFVVGGVVHFDGTGSVDPDGDPLAFAWDFDATDGIGVDATSPAPDHVYSAPGTYTVTLTVADNGGGDPTQICSRTATTTASILPFCPADVFNGYDVIRLAAGRPSWFAYVQPASGCYANTDVVISSIVLKYAGRQIPADVSKTSVGGDKSGDGIQEIRVAFTKPDLRALFTGTGLAVGHNLVTVVIEGMLSTGGSFQGSTQVDVVNNGSFSAASVSPNPLNPEAVLTFSTERAGRATVRMYDLGGRLVRTFLDGKPLEAGIHEVRIDGRGERGEKLPSGVYFLRGTSSEGEFRNTITILK